MLSAKKAVGLFALALMVALVGAGAGWLAVTRLSAAQRETGRLSAANRELTERLDLSAGQLARVRKSFDDAFSQLKSRDALLARAGEVQREIARQQDEQLREQMRRQALWQEMREEIDGALGEGRGAVFLAGDALTVRLPDKLLFGAGSAELSEEGRAVLKKVALLLMSSLKDCAVVVEGHTDDLPIARTLQYKFPTNWELSAARASGAVVCLIERGIAPARLSAVGRGETGAVADNDTEQGRAANRRIDIIIKLETSRQDAKTPSDFN